MKKLEGRDITPTDEANSKNAGGYFEKHNNGDTVHTVHFLVPTGCIIKISMTDDVEKVLTMTVLVVVEKFSYAVNVHRTTQNVS